MTGAGLLSKSRDDEDSTSTEGTGTEEEEKEETLLKPGHAVKSMQEAQTTDELAPENPGTKTE